jgi:hypothetical protein
MLLGTVRLARSVAHRASPFPGRDPLQHWAEAVGVVGFVTHVTEHEVLRVIVTVTHLALVLRLSILVFRHVSKHFRAGARSPQLLLLLRSKRLLV